MIPYAYDIRYPESYDPAKKYPVLFALHGLGSNETNILSLTEDLGEFIRIGIRGDLPHGSGHAYFHIRSIGNPDRELFDRAIAQLQSFIDAAVEKYPIDPKQIYLMGFSQGAILSMTLALTMGSRIQGIAALNGYIPTFVETDYTLQDIRQVRIFLSHGQHDHIFPLERGQQNYDFLRPRSPGLRYKVYASGHEVTPENRSDAADFLRQTFQQKDEVHSS